MADYSFQALYQQRIANSTKPFNARGGKMERCSACQVAKRFCICHAKPCGSNQLASLLLLSENEVLKPSNTGRLIGDVLNETYAFQWSRTEPHVKMLELINSPEYFPIVLFPQQYVDDQQRLLTDTWLHQIGTKKLLLIFLDGSWREARRIFRQSPYLESLPVLSIKPQQMSQYIMRNSANPGHLSTAEVASLALTQLGIDGPDQALLHWFEAFREAYLLSKSQGQGDSGRSALHTMLQFQQNNCAESNQMKN